MFKNQNSFCVGSLSSSSGQASQGRRTPNAQCTACQDDTVRASTDPVLSFSSGNLQPSPAHSLPTHPPILTTGPDHRPRNPGLACMGFQTRERCAVLLLPPAP